MNLSKHTSSFILIAIFIVFSSCSSSLKAIREKQALIDNGMDKKQVIEIMGAPKDRQFKGDDEAWQYCGASLDTYEFVIVWFYKGRVTGLNTYKTYNCPTIMNCEKCFREVNWLEAPDRIVEFRNRNLN